MESKTYVFGENGNNGMMSLLAPLMQKSGLDPNLLLAMNRNNGGFGGEGGWFMWVIFLFFLMGWGGNGWGFGRNNGGGIANEINNDYGRSLLMDAIGGNRNALSNLATQLNCTEGQIQSAIAALTSQVQSVGNQVGMSGMQVINALQQGNMQIAQQIANCCCENRLAMFDKKRGCTICATPFRCVVVWSCYLGIKTNEQSRASHRLSIVLRLALRFPPSIRAMFERATPLFSLSSICDISLPVLACLSALHRRIRASASALRLHTLW